MINTISTNDNLKLRQTIAAKAEAKMLECLLGLQPAQELKVQDVQFIARYARTLAFDALEALTIAPQE